VAGGLTGYFTRSATEPSGAADTRQRIPFYGAHQAGIITPDAALDELRNMRLELTKLLSTTPRP